MEFSRHFDCFCKSLQSINQSIIKSISQSVNQSINQSINQSTSQSVSQPVSLFISSWVEVALILSAKGMYKTYDNNYSKIMKNNQTDQLLLLRLSEILNDVLLFSTLFDVRPHFSDLIVRTTWRIFFLFPFFFFLPFLGGGVP